MDKTEFERGVQAGYARMMLLQRQQELQNKYDLSAYSLWKTMEGGTGPLTCRESELLRQAAKKVDGWWEGVIFHPMKEWNQIVRAHEAKPAEPHNPTHTLEYIAARVDGLAEEVAKVAKRLDELHWRLFGGPRRY